MPGVPYTPLLVAGPCRCPFTSGVVKKFAVPIHAPLAFTLTTYGVFASIATGATSACSCHPDAVSPVKPTVASSCPLAVHTWPVCGPGSPAAFQKRTAVIWPAASLTTRTPSSKLPLLSVAGTCVVSSRCGGGPTAKSCAVVAPEETTTPVTVAGPWLIADAVTVYVPAGTDIV